LARDLQDGLAVDKERAAALLTGAVGHFDYLSYLVADAAPLDAHPTRQRSRCRRPALSYAFGRRLVAKEKSERRHADQEWRSYERGEGDERFGEADHSSTHPNISRSLR
jgi:hypothetical protein